MCLIVDASCASLVFNVPRHPQFEPLWRWLTGIHGRLVYGGKLARELHKVQAAANQLAELRRSGRADFVPDDKIEAEVACLPDGHRSNDLHVLALARLTGARLLCTEDSDLIADFKDRHLIPAPRGRVYRDETHGHLFAAPDHGHSRGCYGHGAKKAAKPAAPRKKSL